MQVLGEKEWEKAMRKKLSQVDQVRKVASLTTAVGQLLRSKCGHLTEANRADNELVGATSSCSSSVCLLQRPVIEK